MSNARTILSIRRGRRTRGSARVVAPLLLAAACSDSPLITEPPGPPTGVPDASLSFLRPATLSQPLLTTDTSFVATRGLELKVELFSNRRDCSSTISIRRSSSSGTARRMTTTTAMASLIQNWRRTSICGGRKSRGTPGSGWRGDNLGYCIHLGDAADFVLALRAGDLIAVDTPARIRVDSPNAYAT